MRTPIVAGNWKMNTEPGPLLDDMVHALAHHPSVLQAHRAGITVVVAPPFLSLATVVQGLRDTTIHVSGQNCHHEASGAFTGEVSASALYSAGATWTIVGHSERRRDALEDDALVGRKAAAAVLAGLRPIICVGESLEQRTAGVTLNVITGQILGALSTAGRDVISASVIAYEPIWAIGTGLAATPDQAQDVHAHIRSVLTSAGISSPIVYGGSVTPENAHVLFACNDIDGALVGGASLKPNSFGGILEAAAAIWGKP